MKHSCHASALYYVFIELSGFLEIRKFSDDISTLFPILPFIFVNIFDMDLKLKTSCAFLTGCWIKYTTHTNNFFPFNFPFQSSLAKSQVATRNSDDKFPPCPATLLMAALGLYIYSK